MCALTISSRIKNAGAILNGAHTALGGAWPPGLDRPVVVMNDAADLLRVCRKAIYDEIIPVQVLPRDERGSFLAP